MGAPSSDSLDTSQGSVVVGLSCERESLPTAFPCLAPSLVVGRRLFQGVCSPLPQVSSIYSENCGALDPVPQTLSVHSAMALALARTLRESARAESAALLRRAVSSATHLTTWIRENEKSFAPPIMNKLMHRDQLSIMFVGGPNRREDFHIEEGSEFFYQLRGNMELPVVQAGRRELVSIREGDVFLLPSRIPHSPQRPEAGSIGLVIERQRYEHEAPDGLRFYTDFATCNELLYERWFRCEDLARDLPPIVKAFKASHECATGHRRAPCPILN